MRNKGNAGSLEFEVSGVNPEVLCRTKPNLGEMGYLGKGRAMGRNARRC
jgi:hypothetical protein